MPIDDDALPTLSRRQMLKSAITATAAIPLATGLLSAFAPAAQAATERARSRFAPPLVRKNVKDLSGAEKQALTDAFLALKGMPSPYNASLNYYDQFVRWHKQAFDCENGAAHMQPAFLPWHRQYLLVMEAALQTASGDPTMTIPYWDWVDPAATQAVFSPDLMGGEGDPSENWTVLNGPFTPDVWVLNVRDPKKLDPWQFREIHRKFNTHGWKLPTQSDVSEALARHLYDVAPWNPGSDVNRSFRNYMEGWTGFTGTACEDNWMEPVKGPNARSTMHNVVHLWVGGQWRSPAGKDAPYTGTMTMNTSPNDPVFWLHHSNIDRLWANWEAIHGQVYLPVHPVADPMITSLHDLMWPYEQIGIDVAPADLLDIAALGYAYG